ncbi:MAG: DNA alkylation repair protein [Candidatus Latescibacterota bacterium]|nr:MAG: DNA alkylation repair protein [Candidatus Latescibacterota bacterium]
MTPRGRASRRTAEGIVARLEAEADPANVAGMARYGIEPKRALGVSAPKLRALAREIGRDHALALALWRSGVREARILAALVDEPGKVTEAQLERWARGFDSWDVCDGACCNLFDRTPFSWEKAAAWSGRREEFVKRAGFVLMAALAVHDKTAPDERFEAFLPVIEREAGDGRNFVKKAVNWALRQIGKRNAALNRRALGSARRIRRSDSAAARWVAADAIRELESEPVRRRLAASRTARRRGTKPRAGRPRKRTSP